MRIKTQKFVLGAFCQPTWDMPIAVIENPHDISGAIAHPAISNYLHDLKDKNYDFSSGKITVTEEEYLELQTLLIKEGLDLNQHASMGGTVGNITYTLRKLAHCQVVVGLCLAQDAYGKIIRKAYKEAGIQIVGAESPDYPPPSSIILLFEGDRLIIKPACQHEQLPDPEAVMKKATQGLIVGQQGVRHPSLVENLFKLCERDRYPLLMRG